MKRILLTSALAAALASLSFGQTLSVGAHGNTFNGNTRGYYFTAPVDMTITGVQVLMDPASVNTFQNFCIVRFDNATPPPPFAATTNAFSQLALGFDLPQNAFQPVTVQVLAGDLIGVMGNTTDVMGATTGANSYTANVQQTSMVAGVQVDLIRTGMQFHLGSATTPGGAQDMFSSTGSRISRVELTYTLGGTGTPFCDPADVNSTGLPTMLSGAMGSGVGSDLHLESSQGPPGQFGYFLMGTTFIEPGIAISNGHLCVSGQIGRFNITGTQFNSLGLFDAGGALLNQVGTATSSSGTGFDVPITMPISGSPMIMPGSSWSFQLWHREAAGASNFSNGVTIMF